MWNLFSSGFPTKTLYAFFISPVRDIYEGISKSFRIGLFERELQMVQLSATRCIGIAILWGSLVSFAAVTLCVASQWMFIVIVVVVYFVMTQSGNFWIHPRIRVSPISSSLMWSWWNCPQLNFFIVNHKDIVS
jgi:hypothetical protein